MKKSGLLNSEVSRVVASLGHGDYLVIGDAGLPVPKGVPLIDLAVTKDVPRFLDVLRGILSELSVEEAIVAQEMEQQSLNVYKGVSRLLQDVRISKVSHAEFKAMIADAKAMIRTGDFTPYSNIILVSSGFPVIVTK